jgi:hypothetical protein
MAMADSSSFERPLLRRQRFGPDALGCGFPVQAV